MTDQKKSRNFIRKKDSNEACIIFHLSPLAYTKPHYMLFLPISLPLLRLHFPTQSKQAALVS